MPPPELRDRAIALHSTPFPGDGFHPEVKQAYLRWVPPFDRRFPPPPACRPQRTGRRQARLLRQRRLDVVLRHPRLDPHLLVLDDVDLLRPVVSLQWPVPNRHDLNIGP